MPKHSILVIDDEKDLLKLLQYNLEKEGYQVFLAENGGRGLALARTRRPDLIVLDLMLPEVDGLEICRMLKMDQEMRAIPVLMLTAKNSEMDQVLGLEIGAADYLTKPFSVKVLLARIKNVLKHSKAAQVASEAVLKSSRLKLDLDKVLFSVDGKQITLTKKEFGILRTLMERPLIMLSRDQLVNRVWGEGSVVSVFSVNMHVKSLRDKLGKYRDSVETVRGLGYRFNPDEA